MEGLSFGYYSGRNTDDFYDLLRMLNFGKLVANYKKFTLNFNRPGTTSRGTLHTRDVYYIYVYEEHSEGNIMGIGEAAPLWGLSVESENGFEEKIKEVCQNINQYDQYLFGDLTHYPSIQFALETALIDLYNGGNRIIFDSKFTQGMVPMPINGLIWMGKVHDMLVQVNEKLELGFNCLKFKVGALDFKEEILLLQHIRESFSAEELEIRLDANGAFKPNDALRKLEQLSVFDIHSLEQPIKAGDWDTMADICRDSPIPVALDEELIGIFDVEVKRELLETILPSYIILKPSLLGGISSSSDWIQIADELGVGWWVTSALESNIGLNAIAQWNFTLNNPMYSGLGTGKLFENNIQSPLYLKGELMYYNPDIKWNLSPIFED